jgi:hypothetical protein
MKSAGAEAKINIGLLNNPYNYIEIANLVSYHVRSLGGIVIEKKLAIGQFNGNPEPTYVASIWIPSLSVTRFIALIHMLTDKFTQESVAYMLDGSGKMAFNSSYNGDRYIFDPQYFQL